MAAKLGSESIASIVCQTARMELEYDGIFSRFPESLLTALFEGANDEIQKVLNSSFSEREITWLQKWHESEAYKQMYAIAEKALQVHREMPEEEIKQRQLSAAPGAEEAYNIFDEYFVKVFDAVPFIFFTPFEFDVKHSNTALTYVKDPIHQKYKTAIEKIFQSSLDQLVRDEPSAGDQAITNLLCNSKHRQEQIIGAAMNEKRDLTKIEGKELKAICDQIARELGL